MVLKCFEPMLQFNSKIVAKETEKNQQQYNSFSEVLTTTAKSKNKEIKKYFHSHTCTFEKHTGRDQHTNHNFICKNNQKWITFSFTLRSNNFKQMH